MNGNIHFIGIAEHMMSDLAIALQQQGYGITGSAAEGLAASQEKLAQVGLWPEQLGWFPAQITNSIDKVIVGRQVQSNNPELQVAQQRGVASYAYATYLYEYAQDKQRIVITGGPASTIICAITIHVLRYWHRAFDYAVDVPGLATTVQLSEAPIMVLQGDSLPTSSIDARPQFLTYQHNIALISSIGEERDASYPTSGSYAQLWALADASLKGGTLIYDEEASLIKEIGTKPRTDVRSLPYQAHPHRYQGTQAYLVTTQGDIPVLYGDNLSLRAIAGARELLQNVGITHAQFYEAIPTCSVAWALSLVSG